MADEVVNLLTEIRDLLRVVSGAAQPQYEANMRKRHEVDIAAILAIVGRSGMQLVAAQLMDGTLTATEVRATTKFDSGNFSKFVKRLKDANVLQEKDGRLALTVAPNVIPWPTPEKQKGK